MKKIVYILFLAILMSLCVSITFAASKSYPVSVIITPDHSTIQAGKYVQLKATVFSNLGKKMSLKVNWNCGAGGIITKSGKFTAGDAAATVPVTVNVVGTQISDTIDVKVIPTFTGTYIGRFDSSDVSGVVSFNVTKTNFKVLFLPNSSDDFSVISSGKINSDGTISCKIKTKDGTVIFLNLSVLDGQNLTGSFTATYYDDNNEFVSFDAAVNTQKNIDPSSGAYYGYWQNSSKGGLAMILDDDGNTYNLVEKANESIYFEGTWNGVAVNATIEDFGEAGSMYLSAKIYPSNTIKGSVSNGLTKPTKIIVPKIK